MTLSALCVECGLCCDGSLFRFLPVDDVDLPTHVKLRLPVVQQSGRNAMPLPCAKLVARCCTVYAQRPGGCRGYVCHLGFRLQGGAVSFDAALAVVREAQRRVEALRAVFPVEGPVVQQAVQAMSANGARVTGEVLDALEAVQTHLEAEVHWPDDGDRGRT